MDDPKRTSQIKILLKFLRIVQSIDKLKTFFESIHLAQNDLFYFQVDIYLYL